MNGATTLEFIANTKNGFKAYESAIELDTNGLTFNLAMILIGLDKANSRPAQFHFDPNEPAGDPVEIWIEWKDGAKARRIRAEDLLWDRERKAGFSRGGWVYTGSIVTEDGRYLADLDGVLIGFVHDPASIIEWVGGNGVGRFGFIEVNPEIGLKPDTPITLTIKAIKDASKR